TRRGGVSKDSMGRSIKLDFPTTRFLAQIAHLDRLGTDPRTEVEVAMDLVKLAAFEAEAGRPERSAVAALRAARVPARQPERRGDKPGARAALERARALEPADRRELEETRRLAGG